jgi:glucokinase
MSYIAGLDIGGTKISVTLAMLQQGTLNIQEKTQFSTPLPGEGWQTALTQIENALEELLQRRNLAATSLSGIGISCGGPLNSKNGVILSPPNLPDWDNVPITDLLTARFSVPCFLQNDADACAAAEWAFGAGEKCDNMIFLTFGTGFGAGMILNSKLYTGACNAAGEIGHCRCPQIDLLPYAPVGYGKAGSFEGFCSGGGIANLGKTVALENLQQGRFLSFCPTWEDLDKITAKSIAQAAEAGDEIALEIYRCSGRHLGAALAFLMDLLNPDRIVIGSIFVRSQKLLLDSALSVIQREALPNTQKACQILPARLGEHLGDVAALSVALLGKNTVDISTLQISHSQQQ